MAQKKLNDQFPLDRTTKIDDVWLRRLLGVLESRLSGVELKATDFDEATALLLRTGLNRINEVLLPAIEQVRDLTQLGFLIASSQTPALLEQDATTLFVIPPGSERDLFTPSTFVILTRDANTTDYAVMRTVSYDRETGDYVGTMVSVSGEPGPFSDWTLGALAGSTIAQMDMLEEGTAIRDETLLLRNETFDLNEDSLIALAATIEERNAVEDMRDEVELDRAAVVAKKAEFDRLYWGRRNTPPPTEGEGAALPGAIYVDESVTPNVVKVLGTGGTWAPAVTVSIGGARQQIYIATAGQTGPFAVDGGFTTGSVNVNGAELYHGHGVTLVPGPAGSFTLSKPLEAGDLVVFSGYLANDATDIFTKRENDARFVRKDGAQALTEQQKSFARANIGGGVLAGYRNKIINGNFDFWQRATSQNSGNYGSADRWRPSGSLGPMTFSRQAFAIGQTDVPGEPAFFGRWAQTGLPGGAINLLQRIESVRTLAGKKATLTFYARLFSGAADIVPSISQYFGSGGAPSANVQLDYPALVLSAAWTKYQMVVDIPAIAGKTLGSNNDDYVSVAFGLPATSGWVVDIAHVSLVEGDASAEADPFTPRHPQQELALCQRYFQSTRIQTRFASAAGGTHGFSHGFSKMRVAPTLTSTVDTANSISTHSVGLLADDRMIQAITPSAGGVNVNSVWSISMDAEL